MPDNSARSTIVVFSHWAWDTYFWQFNKQVGFALGRLGHDVVWIDARLRLRDGVAEWLRAFPFGRLERVDSLWRFRPLSVSRLRLGARFTLPQMLIGKQVRRVLKRLSLHADTALVYTPEENAAVRALAPRHVVYWTGDEVTLPNEDWLVDAADVVLTLSPKTQAEMEARAPGRVVRMPTGVPFDEFVAGAEAADCPAEMAHLPRPIFGFAGGINDRIDFDIIRVLAEANPRATVALVGGVVGVADELATLPANVVMLGPTSYADVPRYLAQFDVGLIPYLRTEFNLGSSPLKLHEYLAVGLPVVSTDLPSSREYGDVVHIENDPGRFVEAAKEAVSLRRDPAFVQRRRELVRVNGVDRIAERVAAIIDGLARGD